VVPGFLCLLILVPSVRPQGRVEPDRLVSAQGLEVRLEVSTFGLFVALNAMGYRQETLFGPPPVEAARFHPIRIEVMHRIPEMDDWDELRPIRSEFAKRPDSRPNVLRRLLAREPELAAAVEPFEGRLMSQPWYTMALERWREDAKHTARQIDTDLVKVARFLRVAPESISLRAYALIPNPLDAHEVPAWVIRGEHSGGVNLVVCGAGREAASRQFFEQVLVDRVDGLRMHRTTTTMMGLPREASLAIGRVVIERSLGSYLTQKALSDSCRTWATSLVRSFESSGAGTLFGRVAAVKPAEASTLGGCRDG
jgi:hypothetical protein